jgi:hypothetical protein
MSILPVLDTGDAIGRGQSGTPNALTRRMQARSWAGRTALIALPGTTTSTLSDSGA